MHCYQKLIPVVPLVLATGVSNPYIEACVVKASSERCLNTDSGLYRDASVWQVYILIHLWIHFWIVQRLAILRMLGELLFLQRLHYVLQKHGTYRTALFVRRGLAQWARKGQNNAQWMRKMWSGRRISLPSNFPLEQEFGVLNENFAYVKLFTIGILLLL